MIGQARAPSNGKAGCRLTEPAAATRPPLEFLPQLGLPDLEHGPGIGIPYLDITGTERAVRLRTALNAGDGRRWPPGTRRSTLGDWQLGVLELCPPAAGARLDCPEAVVAAPCFLPATTGLSGRESKPRSHWGYRVTDPPQQAQDAYRPWCRPVCTRPVKPSSGTYLMSHLGSPRAPPERPRPLQC
jgi:hypothetical protein